MPNKIVHKKSGTTGLAPAPGELEHAELAVNYADSDLYLKNLAGNAVVKVTHASNIKSTAAGNLAATNVQAALEELDSEKQVTLVSGTNIKTVNSTSLLGSGDVAVQPTLVSGTNIKTVNDTSLLGSGNVVVQPLTNGLTDIGADLVDDDEIPVYDTSATANRKSLLSRIWTYISGKLTATANTFTAAQTISVTDNTNPALKITQAGTGHCLVVEDVVSDTTPFVIDASGNVGIGTNAPGGYVGTVTLAGSVPTPVGGYGEGIFALQTIPSSVTARYDSFISSASTVDEAFSLANIFHYHAYQGTITGGNRTTPTNQVGFMAWSNLTGATNNFGFRSDIGAGANRWNFYANGDAANHFRGTTLIGTATDNSSGAKLQVNGAITAGDGSASLPSYSNSDDPNTGIYFPAADTVAIATGGTERVRVDSAGNVGIGSTAGSISLLNNKVITGGVYAYAYSASAQIQSDVTNTGAGYHTELSTQDANFTLANLAHFWANQSTVTGGNRNAPTNQYGFRAQGSLIGATNNYGFFGALTAGTGRWNFYAGGDARNYFAGTTLIGSATDNASGAKLQVNGAITAGDGSASLPAYSNSDDPNTGIYFPAEDTVAIATGGTERIRVDSAGNVAIGGAPSAVINVLSSKNITGGVNAFGIRCAGVVQSDVTGIAAIFSSVLQTQAASFTVEYFYHYNAVQGAIGANSAIVNQYGFRADSSLTGASYNFGFFGNIAAAANCWNFYANGTAQNYFGGNVILKLASSVTPSNNGELMIEATSNTSLTFKYKGSDGVVRSASLTLA